MAVDQTLRAFTRLVRSGVAGVINGFDTNRNRPVQLTMTSYPASPGDPERMSPDDIYRTQPHLRTVVGFIATNVAQLGLHAFKREGEERSRVRDGEVSEWLRKPNSEQTMYEFVEQLVGELALYDAAYVWVFQGPDHMESKVIPTKWVTTTENAFGMVKTFSFVDPTDDTNHAWIDPSEICRFVSWSPGSSSGGSSKVDTLRLIISEQAAAWKERAQVAKRKGRVGGFFSRPADAPKDGWDNGARKRFMDMVHDFTGDHGARAGEDMLLEDGITYSRGSRTPQESQWADSVKLSLVTCAQVYHVNPTMVGVLDNANYSNVKEFNRSLYTDSLGPIIKQLEDRLNAFLMPMLGVDADVFVEFNVEAKLRGSFEERAAVISKATGGPWWTRNEARKLDNMPPVDGGDELIVPKNVSEGGLASPEDGGDGRPEDAKSREEVEMIVRPWIERMNRSVSAKRKAGNGPWWDPMRWQRELETDLVKADLDPADALWLAARLTEEAGHAFQAGGQPDSAIAMLEAAA